jgi:hypothetical protein
MRNKFTPFMSAGILFYMIICLAVQNQRIDIGWVNLASILAAIDYIAVSMLQDFIYGDDDFGGWDD